MELEQELRDEAMCYQFNKYKFQSLRNHADLVAEAARDSERLDALETVDCWIDLFGPCDDLWPTYCTGPASGLTVREAADRIIEGKTP